jgi:hypothetical protein
MGSVTLFPQRVLLNLKNQSFLQEFATHSQEYIELAHQIALAARDGLLQQGLFILKSEEEFAEDYLVGLVAVSLLSEFFPYFRQALKRRPYIDQMTHTAWARSMARYVLKTAIDNGVLL